MAGTLTFFSVKHNSLHDREKGFPSSERGNYFEKLVLSSF
jgi:hypothetical protein